MDIETLKIIGGSEWIKDDYHRIYFKNLEEFYGLKCSYYKSGNISEAWLDGKRISNSQAKKIQNSIGRMKVWFDVKAQEFKYGLEYHHDSGVVIAKAIIRAIKEKADQVNNVTK